MNCVVVDDEPLAAAVLEKYIAGFPSLALVKKCENAFEAIDYLYKNRADLLFLDINMPEIDGLTFLKSLKNPPLTVFTTAYREYAVDGYDLNILDFLLKPFAFDRFAMAVHKAQHLYGKNAAGTQPENAHAQETIFVKTGNRMKQLPLAGIRYIEGMKDYLKIYLEDERLVVKETMKNMEAMLPESRFYRVHKSFIVALDTIQEIGKDQLIINGMNIPVGRSYREHFLRRLKKESGRFANTGRP